MNGLVLRSLAALNAYLKFYAIYTSNREIIQGLGYSKHLRTIVDARNMYMTRVQYNITDTVCFLEIGRIYVRLPMSFPR